MITNMSLENLVNSSSQHNMGAVVQRHDGSLENHASDKRNVHEREAKQMYELVDAYLHSEIGQEYIASAIFRGFRTYKENFEGTTSKKVSEGHVVVKGQRAETLTPKKEITTDKVVYKVQIGTYLKSMLSDKSFMNLNAYEEIINGTYKYYVGNAYNKVSADNVKIKMREKGFKGAFVVAFYQDKRISMQEALDLQTKNK